MKNYSATFVVLLFAFSARAAEYDSLLARFQGDWRSDGNAFGVKAESFMSWSLTLDGRFVSLDYKIEMTPAAGQINVFQGIAYYRIDQDQGIDAFWADNSGDLHPISARYTGNAIIADWGTDGGKQGRTRYALLSPDEIEVTDWLKTQDAWQEFNRNVFARIEDANHTAPR